LCHELIFGVVRWQATLDWLIARKTPGRTQKPGLQDLLRLGLYQIFWLDRIPDHAAVHETVEMASTPATAAGRFRERHPARLFARSGRYRRTLAELKIAQPALGWSHPEWLVSDGGRDSEKSALSTSWNGTTHRQRLSPVSTLSEPTPPTSSKPGATKMWITIS